MAGIPPLGYGQDYYTLRSIFCDGFAPPYIHVHLRMFSVKNEVPIGNPDKGEVDVPSGEKETFDKWLQRLWREKDESMERFHTTGQFRTGARVDIPVELRNTREILDAFCFFWPAAVAYGWGKLTRA